MAEVKTPTDQALAGGSVTWKHVWERQRERGWDDGQAANCKASADPPRTLRDAVTGSNGKERAADGPIGHRAPCSSTHVRSAPRFGF